MWKGLSSPIAAADGLTALHLAMLGATGPADAFDGKYGFHEVVTGPVAARRTILEAAFSSTQVLLRAVFYAKRD